MPHTPPPKIAIVGNNWFPDRPGGLDRYVYELAHTLADTNHTVDLFALDLPSQSSVPGLHLTSLTQTEFRLGRRLYDTYRHSRPLQLEGFDAINIHFALYGLPVLLHLPKDVPVTFNFHGPWALESQQEGAGRASVAFKRWVEQRVYDRCDRFIVLSKAFGTVLNHTYDIPWERIHIIPGGVDTDRFQNNLTRDAARTQLGWPTDRFILFTPRRLVHRMGIGPLLTALAQVRQRVPEVWLAIAGKGPLRDDLEHQVAELGLGNCVRFLGFVPDDDLPVAYQATDLTVIPSQALEGFGLVLLESLACGTPAACTPVGGMPEVIQPFAPELVFDSGEVSAIAGQLIDLSQQTIPRPSREACRAYVVSQFSWSKIAGQVSNILLQRPT